MSTGSSLFGCGQARVIARAQPLSCRRRACTVVRCQAARRGAPNKAATAEAPQAEATAVGASPQVANGSTSQRLVRFGFPKGSLQKSTEELFARAGFKVKISERGYFPRVDDDELQMVLFRSQEISRYVEDGVLDCGICGYDWIVENGADVVEVCELKYSKATSNPARWVLAVPEHSPVQRAQDLAGTIVASELVNTTRRFFEDRGIAVRKVEYSWGATEASWAQRENVAMAAAWACFSVKASLPGVGAIVDITETGSSLRANNLRVIDTILASTTRLIANKAAWEDPGRRTKIEDVAALLQGAIAGKEKIGLKMNLHQDRLEEVSALLPAERSPTVSRLTDGSYVAVEVVLDERQARALIPACRRLGATGIFTYPIEVIIH